MFLKRIQWKGLARGCSARGSAGLVKISEEELKTRSALGAGVIDIRLGIEFAQGHFPGSLNVGLAGCSFAACVGLFLSKQSQILLVLDNPENAGRAQVELARAGFDQVLGFTVVDDLTELHQLTQLSVFDLKSTLSRGGKPAILDVRSPGEWKLKAIPGSRNIPLEQLTSRVSELSNSTPLVVVCKGGYQSAAASSWLQANGFDSVHHLLGGMDAYTSAPYNECIEALSFCSLQPGAFQL
jgi:hydroxyacylglutathione hydrolase